jgi:YihY family inner membrane protein
MTGAGTMRPEHAALRSGPGRETQRIRAILGLAVRTFLRNDGAQWASAFAFNAFFALFPLMILLVTIVSFFVGRDGAGDEVIHYLESYVPISGEMQSHLFNAIAAVIRARGQAGAIAFLILIWAALQCFTTLIAATNRAWNVAEYSWWRRPLKSLLLLGTTAGAVLLGMGAPVLMRMAKDRLISSGDFHYWIYALESFVVPLLVVFFSLCLFYRLAPRRPTRFAEVWAAALCATALLQAAESLFVIYLGHFATFNALYGAFGGIMALLLWIYLTGCIFIFGACLCAAGAAIRSKEELRFKKNAE